MSDEPPPATTPASTPGTPATPDKPGALDVRSGAWVIGFVLVVLLLVTSWLYRITRERIPPPPGIDLSTAIVDRQVLVPATTLDALPAIVAPSLLSAEEAERLRLPEHGKNLVPSDRVIGVAIGGEARAYPLRVLDWHEVAHDVVGGVPIAVTWSPLTGTARAFDRRVGGEVLDLVASGVVWNSNLCLMDRRAGGVAPTGSAAVGPSLWSQLLGRAITGPAAARGDALTPVRAQLVSWAAWRQAHPDTRVLSPDLERAKLYKREAYSSYASSEVLRFPVAPLPPAVGREARAYALKTPVVVVGRPGEHVVYPLSVIAQRRDAQGVWSTTQAGVPITFRYEAPHQSRPASVFVELPPDAPFDVIPTWWFGWYATHPDDAKLVE